MYSLVDAKLFYQLVTVCFVFRNPLNIINTALIKEFLDKEGHLVFAFDFAFDFAFFDTFCNATIFHFIKYITHIAWASFLAIGIRIVRFLKPIIIVAYRCEIYKHLPYATFNLVAL